jgi:hypothetical protein
LVRRIIAGREGESLPSLPTKEAVIPFPIIPLEGLVYFFKPNYFGVHYAYQTAFAEDAKCFIILLAQNERAWKSQEDTDLVAC